MDNSAAPAPEGTSPQHLAARVEAMELDRRLGSVQETERVEQLAAGLGETQLSMRARAARADALGRSGEIPQALGLLAEVRAWAVSRPDNFVLARSHFLESIIHSMLGDSAAATHHACLGVDGLPDDVPAAVRARHLVSLALSLDDMRVGDGADYFQEALDIGAATGDVALSLSVLGNLTWNELETGDLPAAVALVDRMQAVSRRSGVPLRAADLETIARVELRQGDPAAAERVLLPLVAEPPQVVLTELMSLPSGLRTMAEAQRLLGRLSDAQRNLDRARLLCEASALTGIAAEVSREQAEVYAAAGRFEEAYHEHRRFHAASEALLSADRDARARATQHEFESREGRRESERYRELALRDALTGLYNRRFIDMALPTAIENACQERRPLSVAIVDVDFFKRVNDTLSHDVGDLVLTQVAGLVAAAVEEPASAARLGGEEFLLMLPNTGAVGAMAVAEALRAAVQDHEWSSITGDLSITVSIGVGTSEARGTTQSTLLQQADLHLYAAKHGGRNRVVG